METEKDQNQEFNNGIKRRRFIKRTGAASLSTVVAFHGFSINSVFAEEGSCDRGSDCEGEWNGTNNMVFQLSDYKDVLGDSIGNQMANAINTYIQNQPAASVLGAWRIWYGANWQNYVRNKCKAAAKAAIAAQTQDFAFTFLGSAQEGMTDDVCKLKNPAISTSSTSTMTIEVGITIKGLKLGGSGSLTVTPTLQGQAYFNSEASLVTEIGIPASCKAKVAQDLHAVVSGELSAGVVIGGTVSVSGEADVGSARVWVKPGGTSAP